jgi:hypothetical protein
MSLEQRNHEQVSDYENQLREQQQRQQPEIKSPKGLVENEKGKTRMHPLLAGRTKGLIWVFFGECDE